MFQQQTSLVLARPIALRNPQDPKLNLEAKSKKDQFDNLILALLFQVKCPPSFRKLSFSYPNNRLYSFHSGIVHREIVRELVEWSLLLHRYRDALVNAVDSSQHQEKV